jgi:SAM-dependent methyltransferase
MPVEWLQGAVRARCPVCGVAGEKRVVLTAEHVIPGPRVTFLRCSDCGAAFLDDLTPPDYGEETPEMLDYYVEQGAGIDLIVAPLLRVPPASVRRCLEIGCSFPFALDFARFAFGWDVLGVDPSPLADKGAEQLGVPVRHTYFDAELDAGREPLDLVLCSEILEHVGDPYSLLSSIRERLSPEGMLVLSTPNAAILRNDTEDGMLARALSPGFHLILYDASALERVLNMAGFEHIVIEESYETLRAFAACSPRPIRRLLPPDPVAAHALLRNYFGARKKQVPLNSALASGLAYRHFKECVNAGFYDEAIESRDFLDRVIRERSAPLPFNLSCILFFSGILQLNGLGDPGKAAEAFAAAIDAGERLRASSCPFAVYDGETEMLLRQSRKHLPMALAATDPERALREIERLESMDRSKFPAVLLDETRAQTFVRLVNAGAYEAAERMVPDIASLIERHPPEAHAGSPGALDPLYCLGMLALQRGRAEDAAELFHRVAVAASTSPAQEDILRSARQHEVQSRKLRQC